MLVVVVGDAAGVGVPDSDDDTVDEGDTVDVVDADAEGEVVGVPLAVAPKVPVFEGDGVTVAVSEPLPEPLPVPVGEADALEVGVPESEPVPEGDWKRGASTAAE